MTRYCQSDRGLGTGVRVVFLVASVCWLGLDGAAGQSAQVIRGEVERSLAGVLNKQQRTAWDMLALGTSQPMPAPGQSPAAGEASPSAESSEAPSAEAPASEAAKPAEAPSTEAPAPEPVKPAEAPSTEAPAPEPVKPAEAPSIEAPAPEPVKPAEAPSTEPPVPEPVKPAEAPSTEAPAPEPVKPAEAPLTEAPAPEPVKPAQGGQPAGPSELSDAELLKMLEAEVGEKPPEGQGRLRFNFRYQPWEDVLDWFARQAGLSLVYETLPQGTCNYVDNREYTIGEALDVLNSLLLMKGYTLVRRERMLLVANLDDLKDGLSQILVATVPVKDLDQRGEYELVSTVFQLEKIAAEEAKGEIEKLIGPQGSIVILPKAQQIVVTEMAGRLRTIRDALQRIEDPEGLSSLQLRSFPLDFALADEMLAILRQLFGIAADQNAAPDGSIRFAADPLGMRLIVFGTPSKLEQVAKVLEAIDGPGTGEQEAGAAQTSLQVEVYNVAPADPESVLKVMQTLLQGTPGTRLSTDPKTGNLIALARPEDHATIRATLEQLINDATSVDVIQLRFLDPQVAVLSITKLFGGGEGSTLKVDADPTTRRLVIRGPKTLIGQIRTWLEQMGETGGADATAAAGGNVRMLPISGPGASSALELLQQIWPTMHRNKIRVVTPSAVIPTLRVGRSDETSKADDAVFERLFGPQPLTPGQPAGEAPASQGQAPPPAPRPGEPAPPPPKSPPADRAEPEAKSAARDSGSRPPVFFASETVQTAPDNQSSIIDHPVQAPEPPAIIVALGPGGIMIASDDIEALNDFEQLLTSLASGAVSGSADLTLFYLVHAQASVVAETLDQIFGGGTVAERNASGGGPQSGDLAGAAFGDAGGPVGSLLGLGGGTITPSGSVRIIPDTRLNALVVRANPTDTDTIRQLLEILDQKGTPDEILAQPKPRLIPVYNTLADEVAEIVRQVYQDRMATGSGRQPTPQEFLEAIRGGGRGRGRSSSRSSTEDVQKMSIGIDARTNSLVVSAPDSLFQEVKQLVEELDAAAIGSSTQAVQVVTLKGSNAEAVQKALSTLVGQSLTSSRTGSSSRGRSSSSQSSQGGPTPFSGGSMEDMQRRMEFFRALREGGGGMGGGFRGPFGGGRPSSGGQGPGGGFQRPGR